MSGVPKRLPDFLRLGANWGIHESTAKQIQNRVEEILLKNLILHVPGKKRLTRDRQLEFVIVDVSKIEIERPKKTAQVLQWQKETP